MKPLRLSAMLSLREIEATIVSIAPKSLPVDVLEELRGQGLVEVYGRGRSHGVKITDAGRAALKWPVPAGREATTPEEGECSHGVKGQVHRWIWNPKRGDTEAESEPEVLDVPASCHACNCDDPFCPRCE